MKRALVTGLICILSLYIGIVLIVSWDIYDHDYYNNIFVESFWGLLNALHFVSGLLFMFAPMGIILYRHIHR